MKSVRLRNRILIVTAVWQRHDLTDIVLSYYSKLAARCDGKLMLLAVGSEGNKSKNLCERNGWRYIEHPNLPLSTKWNAVVQKAGYFNFDFVVMIGSDDLLSLPLIRYYDNNYSREADYMLGLKDLYYYMMKEKKSYYFKGYDPLRTLQTLGAGRCLSRRILKRIQWKPWHYYAINRGLDSRLSSHLSRCGIQEKSVKLSETKGVGIDIKHYRTSVSDSAVVISVCKKSRNILKAKFPEEYIRINSINV